MGNDFLKRHPLQQKSRRFRFSLIIADLVFLQIAGKEMVRQRFVIAHWIGTAIVIFFVYKYDHVL